MADKTVNQLTEDTAPTADDYVLMWDIGTSTTKKVTIAELLALILNSSSSDFAWASWTPTLSGRFTNADWTKASKFTQIGKTVFFNLHLTSADATPMAGGSGQATFTLPVTSVAYATNRYFPGNGILVDDSGNTYQATIFWESTTTASVYSLTGASGIAAGITSAAPFTWTTSDVIDIWGFYQAA